MSPRDIRGQNLWHLITLWPILPKQQDSIKKLLLTIHCILEYKCVCATDPAALQLPKSWIWTKISLVENNKGH